MLAWVQLPLVDVEFGLEWVVVQCLSSGMASVCLCYGCRWEWEWDWDWEADLWNGDVSGWIQCSCCLLTLCSDIDVSLSNKACSSISGVSSGDEFSDTNSESSEIWFWVQLWMWLWTWLWTRLWTWRESSKAATWLRQTCSVHQLEWCSPWAPYSTGNITTEQFFDKFFAHCSQNDPELRSTHRVVPNYSHNWWKDCFDTLGLLLPFLDVNEVMDMTHDHFEQLPMGAMLVPGPVVTGQVEGEPLLNQIMAVKAHIQHLSKSLESMLEEKIQKAVEATATMSNLRGPWMSWSKHS
ncbi:uncharacterized protein BJ212DRAFT_1297412 [Suillus subaureus]|uniref:Uncharacterized protein n=1 Tax=Suillus subaureus TaxID=48587 RepID=A0A9P7JGK9_9AGAM|nr:uncharacterized protein BJ212DRAFT_1297412 [Suillus subaureus]KAG1820934.1 hypothetical protein BJ212DRAFT_1297412 [Suillus subaureus]